jgi:hypothetical protein
LISAKGADQFNRHALGRDREVGQRALGLGAPKAICRDFDAAERVFFQPRHGFGQYHLSRCQLMPGAEFNIQFVDHFCPVGIVTNCLAEQAGLRRAPEIRLMQFYRFGQWPMGGDKAGDRCVIIRQPELGKQVTHFVYRTFHDSLGKFGRSFFAGKSIFSSR